MPFFLQETNKWWLPGAVAKYRWFRMCIPERRWSPIPINLRMNIPSSIIQSVSSVVLSLPRTLILTHIASLWTGPFAVLTDITPIVPWYVSWLKPNASSSFWYKVCRFDPVSFPISTKTARWGSPPYRSASRNKMGILACQMCIFGN